MKLVGMMSTYKEGALTMRAIESLQAVGLDDLVIFEGPAGATIEGGQETFFPSGVVVRTGVWRTDARKRTAMLEHVKSLHDPADLWGVIVDGDEILVNGEYLRDSLQAFIWNHPEKPNYPLMLSEGDGSLSTLLGRVIRLADVRRYVVSTSILELTNGEKAAWGNLVGDAGLFMEMIDAAGAKGKMMAWPPFPCQPHIFHRSGLRHPDRAGNRMHQQEADELAREGIGP